MLSAYEQERLKNIARNDAVLEALGLKGGGCLGIAKQPQKRKRHDDDAPSMQTSLEPSRRSSRVSKQAVTYTELSDEFMLQEERRIERSRRPVNKVARLEDQQAAEQRARDEASARRRAAKLRVEQQEQQRILRAAHEARIEQARNARVANGHAVTRVITGNLPPMVNNPMGQRYPTTTPQRECSICGGWFVPRQDGSLRYHTCIPREAVLPLF